MAIVIQTDRPKSVRNRCVIEVFGGVFCVVTLLFDFSVDVGAFVIVRSLPFSLMQEQFRLNVVSLNIMFKIFQNYLRFTLIWIPASHELKRMHLII